MEVMPRAPSSRPHLPVVPNGCWALMLRTLRAGGTFAKTASTIELLHLMSVSVMVVGRVTKIPRAVLGGGIRRGGPTQLGWR